MFSLILTVKILFGDKKMDPLEWRYFLAGPTGSFDVPPNCTDWLGDLEFNEMYKQLAGAAKTCEKLTGIEKFFLEHDKEF